MDTREIKVKDLDPKAFIKAQAESTRAAVGGGTAVVALSGGLDSSVVTMLGHHRHPHAPFVAYAGPAGQADHHRGRRRCLRNLQHHPQAAIHNRGGLKE